MEFIRGRPLTDYVRSGGIGTAERLNLLVRICDAVEHAHRHGVVHRDLKPANILVVDKEGSGFGVQGSESAADAQTGILNPESRTLNPQPKILDFAEAERRLLFAWRRMAPPNELIPVAHQELARLYEAWHRPEEAARWRGRLDGSPADGRPE